MVDLVNRLVLDIGPTLRAIDQAAARVNDAFDDVMIEVNADLSEIEDAQDLLAAIDGEDVQVDVIADASELMSAMDVVSGLDGTNIDVSIDADSSMVDDVIDLVETLDGSSADVDVDIGFDDGRFAEIEARLAEIDRLEDQNITVDLDIDDGEFQDFLDEQARRRSLTTTVEVEVDDFGLGSLESSIAELDAIIDIGTDVDIGGISDLESTLDALSLIHI